VSSTPFCPRVSIDLETRYRCEERYHKREERNGEANYFSGLGWVSACQLKFSQERLHVNCLRRENSLVVPLQPCRRTSVIRDSGLFSSGSCLTNAAVIIYHQVLTGVVLSLKKVSLGRRPFIYERCGAATLFSPSQEPRFNT